MMTKELNEKFESVVIQTLTFYREISLLAKKSPDGLINKFKLGFINQSLTYLNEILENDHKPFPDFSTFDEDSIPTNSDVVMILAQYLKALPIFFNKQDTTLRTIRGIGWYKASLVIMKRIEI